jgi:hypothetical protein
MTTNQPDPFQLAHLAYMRGQKQEARDMLDALLSAQPGHTAAIKLRDKIEREMVQDEVYESQRQEVALADDLRPEDVRAYALIGVGALGYGNWRSVDFIQFGMQIGFSTQVRMRSGNNPQTGHYPVHVGLIFPLICVTVGVVCLWKVVRNLRG